MKRFRTVFMGTPDFAVPCLEKLIETVNVVGVVTQPDKPKGRGRKMTPPPVKVCALEHGIDVLQPRRVKDPEAVQAISGMNPELIIVVAFGQILSQEILDIPEYGCINVHASLLPEYRGAAPMQWCIVNGEAKTGVTTMQMDAGLDTGDMLLQSSIDIDSDITYAGLSEKLSAVGAELLIKTLKELDAGTLKPVKQDNDKSSYAPLLTRDTGKIDWNRPSTFIHNLVRGLDPWPGAYSELDGHVIKIWRTRTVEGTANVAPGTVTECGKKYIRVTTGDGLIDILELQAPGKKRMRAVDFINGHGIALPARFGVDEI